MKYYGVSAIALLVGLSACSSNPNPLSVIDTPMIKYKTEKVQAAVKQIPKWYKKLPTEANKIYSVGASSSPDLQLSIEKAKMMAKSELADIIKGEMNKESKQFIKELGKTETKTVVTEVETVLVNIISETPVRGYEIFAQDVTLTKNGYYRTWIGIRLPLGKFNKMYNYTIEQTVDAYNLNEESIKAWDSLKKKDDDNNL